MDNPGLPEHEPRPTDVDQGAERRAERQVATLFGVATLLSFGFCVAYFAIPKGALFLGFSAHNFTLGLTLGGALLLIGIGAIQWAKKLMDDHEITEDRHPASSSADDREATVAAFAKGAGDSGIGRRPLIRNSLLGAMGALGLPAIVALRDLGPLPEGKPSETIWRKGMRVVVDVTGEPIRPEDMELGTLVNAEPDILVENAEFDGPDEENLEGHELLAEKAKAAVIMVRMDPRDVTPYEGRENWGVDGILCYSKICTHVGCPISLYEQTTHHLLCPCHQSTFDLADNGEVIFGPAARSLPQLPLAVDDEGYLIAMSDFREPVGPSFWERGGEEDRSV
ncbi:MAG TPA: Rieske 2Fe-2S domain-containing protein [Nocardioidaceae bacterium]|nr:Rieske 2Fe-2S domain-containing protein [Nocardioidaceae bacterium]